MGCSAKKQVHLEDNSQNFLPPVVDAVDTGEKIDTVCVDNEKLPSKTLVVVLPNSTNAKKIIEGATLALNNSGLNDVSIIFMREGDVVDYKLKAANAILIGFNGKGVKNICSMLDEEGVPIIAFGGRNESLNEKNVFIIKDYVEDEVFFLLNHAISQGDRHIAILSPGGAYSDKFLSKTISSIAKSGVENLKFEILNYDEKENLLKLAQFNGQSVLVLAKGNKLSEIMNYLTEQLIDLRVWQVFGLSDWLDEKPHETYPFLSGAKFCYCPSENKTSFKSQYQYIFNKQVTSMTIMTYDMISCIIAAIDRPEGLQGEYIGVGGCYRFEKGALNGDNIERVYSVEQLPH